MSVLNFSPDILQRIHRGEGYEDENGDYHEGKTTYCNPIRCSSKSNSKANVVKIDKGEDVTYSYEIMLPKGVKPFEYGEIVLFTPYGREPQQYKVLGYQPYQTHAKLWL